MDIKVTNVILDKTDHPDYYDWTAVGSYDGTSTLFHGNVIQMDAGEWTAADTVAELYATAKNKRVAVRNAAILAVKSIRMRAALLAQYRDSLGRSVA